MFNYFCLDDTIRVLVVLCLKSEFLFFVAGLGEGSRDKLS